MHIICFKKLNTENLECDKSKTKQKSQLSKCPPGEDDNVGGMLV